MEYFYNFDNKNRERFQYERYAEWSDECYDVLNSHFLNTLKEMKPEGEFLVTADEQRIDIISYLIYGDVKYWWILLEYNDIIDQFTLKVGDTIKFFKLSDLESKYFSMINKQNALKRADAEIAAELAELEQQAISDAIANATAPTNNTIEEVSILTTLPEASLLYFGKIVSLTDGSTFICSANVESPTQDSECYWVEI